ncbi:MAG: gliding motility protein GldC [Flavobacteriales bacterium]|jgi:gliding motility-associated protein GldC|nr:gliding motility protein GldC [Flavobacteriales bacterium]MCB0759420.1 gliding motility protein GldC [Flavobacteriales bacterium]
MAEKSKIQITVQLDENKVPEHIEWEAEDGGGKGESRAVLLSLWDSAELNTMRIDLWTKEMTTDEMKAFFHQNFLTLADTFERATGEDKMAAQLRDFAAYFAKHMLPEVKK